MISVAIRAPLLASIRIKQNTLNFNAYPSRYLNKLEFSRKD